MKHAKWLCGLCSLLLCAALLLSACGQAVVEPESGMDIPQSQGLGEVSSVADIEPDTAIKAENVDLSNMDDVTAAFLAPLTTKTLLYSWESASEISADNLIGFCTKNNLLNLPQDEEGGYAPEYINAPADEVEEALKKHFNVSSEHLRNSRWYDADTKTYALVVGGGGVGHVAISAEQKENKIMIAVGIVASDDEENEDMTARKKAMPYYPHILEGWIVFPSGMMTVELNDENVVTYISYELNDSFQW